MTVDPKMSDFISHQSKIFKIKTIFENLLSKNLGLTKIRSPIFLTTPIFNDNLDNSQEIVSFFLKNKKKAYLLHSLAKYKRGILYKYKFDYYKGILTDMKAVRRDEEIDNLHSFYVDQFDWELRIKREDRNLNFLFEVVNKIFKTLKETELEILKSEILKSENEKQILKLPEKIFFISAEELSKLFPDLPPAKREYLIVKKHQIVFLHQIGKKIKNEKQTRASDYDDWNLNGDILVYHKKLDCVLELSSMGIRVNKEALLRQRMDLENDLNNFDRYHENIINDLYPQSVGGGIGQSRLFMYLMGEDHIMNVQAVTELENN